MGGLLLGLSLLLVVQATRCPGTGDGEEPFPRGPDLTRVAAVSLSLVLFVLVIRLLGYAISSALLMAAVLRILGQRRWTTIAAISAACAILSDIVFARLLAVPLPSGLLLE